MRRRGFRFGIGPISSSNGTIRPRTTLLSGQRVRGRRETITLVPDLVIREMTRSEFDEWRDSVVRSFADEQIAAGNWSAAEAVDLATRANDSLLPDGFATAGMLFLRAELPDGSYVGVLWLGLTHPRGTPDCAFIYDIEVDAAHRGAGYGRALLAAAEDAVRARGVGAVELNVFGDNARAIRLYETSGYRVVTQQMRKSLA
jgi:ribosomal protein S18 acetylase RimI-like enzyme